MLSELTVWIIESIRTHGILAVILGVAIETIIVPLPSPLIVMAAGYILIPQGPLLSVLYNSLWIAIVAGLAQTIGSYFLFFIGYYGGKPIIEKYEKFHGVSWKEIKQFQKKFSKSKKEDFTLFFMRLLPIMPLSVISGVAGVIKYDVKRYSLATFFGVVPRNIFLALIGYNFGELYSLMAGRIDHAETIMTILIVLLIGFYIIGKKTGLFDGVRKKFLN